MERFSNCRRSIQRYPGWSKTGELLPYVCIVSYNRKFQEQWNQDWHGRTWVQCRKRSAGYFQYFIENSSDKDESGKAEITQKVDKQRMSLWKMLIQE